MNEMTARPAESRTARSFAARHAASLRPREASIGKPHIDHASIRESGQL